MKIDHIALYVSDLERMRTFYTTYFGGISNTQYHNPKTGLRTYFLSFQDGSRLELMSRPELEDSANRIFRLGLIHLAFAVGSRDSVDSLTTQLKLDGYTILSEPRTTGDGYYESCILDPEDNQVEITV